VKTNNCTTRRTGCYLRGRNIIYRPDIDGLRAVAILSVIAFHAAPRRVPGGFVGVDVFFVISGYLIAGLILAGLKDGTFSFGQFYGRRIRRLFPALAIVLAATLPLGWAELLPDEFASLGWYVAASAGFCTNLLANSDVGYFDGPRATKPLLHLWSLGVEEQFYIVFPTMLVVLCKWGRAAPITLAVVGVLSFAANVALVATHPPAVFYMPMTRFWEFLIGAGLAYRASRAPPRSGPQLSADAKSVSGFLLVLVGVAIAREDHFPGWMALIPTLGAVLLIAAGPEAWINRRLLAHRSAVYIGLISYPLYLWHWPLLVVGGALQTGEYSRRIGAILLAFALAGLTYRLIERPVRQASLEVGLRKTAAALSVCLACIAVVGVAISLRNGIPERFPPEIRELLLPIAYGQNWPKQIDHQSGPTVVALGDSFAGHLMAGLYKLQERRPFRVTAIGWDRCASGQSGDEHLPCPFLRPEAKEQLRALKPDIILVSAAWIEYGNIADLAKILVYLKAAGIRKIVLLGPVPYWPVRLQKLLLDQFNASGRKQVPERLQRLEPRNATLDRELRSLAAELGISYISPEDIFCDPNGCLIRIGSRAEDLLQMDRAHFTAAGSIYFIDAIERQVFE